MERIAQGRDELSGITGWGWHSCQSQKTQPVPQQLSQGGVQLYVHSPQQERRYSKKKGPRWNRSLSPRRDSSSSDILPTSSQAPETMPGGITPCSELLTSCFFLHLYSCQYPEDELGGQWPFLLIPLLNVDILNTCPFSAFQYDLLFQWSIKDWFSHSSLPHTRF